MIIIIDTKKASLLPMSSSNTVTDAAVLAAQFVHRPRRLRRTASVRRMVRETQLSLMLH